MYHPTSLFVAVLAFAYGLGVHAQSTTTTLGFDNNYDNANLSLDKVACSDGANGLETKNPNFKTLGSLPNFPNVGGVFTVLGWNSTACGTCYAVTYGDATVNILAVDASQNGFTVSEAAMNTLTGGQAQARGRIDVSYTLVDSSVCKL